MDERFTDRVASLIASVFDAAETPVGLAPALAEIGDLLDADGAHTLTIDSGGLLESHFWCTDDLRPNFVEYEQHWQLRDPRQSVAAQRFGQVLSDVAAIDPGEFERSAVYNEHLLPSRVRYSLFTHTRISPDLVLGQAFLRRPGRGAFGPEEVRALETLLPHLRRALYLRQLVGTMRDELSDLRRALDVVPGAVTILDGNAKLVCANTAAERLLGARDGMVLDGQKLSATRSNEAQKIACAVREAARFAEGAGRPGPADLRVVRITRERGRPLGLVIAPLRPTNAVRSFADRHARVLLAIHDPDAKLTLDPALIARLHDFTEVEALLASALARGLTLAAFAPERRCSVHTARTHLKRILEKSGTRRQTDLVRVLLGSAALHMASS